MVFEIENLITEIKSTGIGLPAIVKMVGLEFGHIRNVLRWYEIRQKMRMGFLGDPSFWPKFRKLWCPEKHITNFRKLWYPEKHITNLLSWPDNFFATKNSPNSGPQRLTCTPFSGSTESFPLYCDWRAPRAPVPIRLQFERIGRILIWDTLQMGQTGSVHQIGSWCPMGSWITNSVLQRTLFRLWGLGRGYKMSKIQNLGSKIQKLALAMAISLFSRLSPHFGLIMQELLFPRLRWRIFIILMKRWQLFHFHLSWISTCHPTRKIPAMDTRQWWRCHHVWRRASSDSWQLICWCQVDRGFDHILGIFARCGSVVDLEWGLVRPKIFGGLLGGVMI